MKRLDPVFDILGLAFWLFLGGVRLAQAWQLRSLTAVLLAAYTGIIVYLLAGRRSDVAAAPAYQKVIAWVSALLPLALDLRSPTSWAASSLAILGILLAMWSMLSLGKAFGVAPADRGLTRSGPYRFLRHPLYAGELLVVLSAAWSFWSPWNLAVLVVLLVSVVARIHWEERTFQGYPGYTRQVRWRVLPGIW